MSQYLTPDASSPSTVTSSSSSPSSSSRNPSRRHSHEPQTLTEIPTSLRHTQSQYYGRRVRKVHTKSPEPVIFETDDTAALETPQIRISIANSNEMPPNREKSSRQSHGSQRHSHANLNAYDNIGFVTDNGRISRASSAANSIRSSGRNPSLQSLSVVREQYWCCSQRSPCERTLFATIGVLVFIIIILIIIVAVLAASKS